MAVISLFEYWHCEANVSVVQSQNPGNTQTPTAFTKGQTTNLHLTKGEKIPFNKRITEFGATFDAEGAFVCQTPGLYAFTFYGLTEQNWELWLEMMKNDQLIASSKFFYCWFAHFFFLFYLFNKTKFSRQSVPLPCLTFLVDSILFTFINIANNASTW